MAETITHTWQTVEQAAVTLNVSTRTIARRLATSSLESRVDENGRRLVLVQQISPGDADDLSDGLPGDAAADRTGDDSALAVATAPAISAGNGLSPPAGSPGAVTMLTVLQSTVTAARDDARSARRTAKWAWAGVGVMAAVLLGGAAIVSSTLTRTSVTTGLLHEQLAETRSELKQTQAELMATRTAEAMATRDLGDARRVVDERRREVSAAAVRVVSSKPTPAATPATQPTLMDRVVSLLGGEAP